MPQGGQLAITTAGVEFDEFAAAQSAPARPGSFVCLSVADTGSGIPPEVLPKIFEAFFTTKGVGKGTGLGLATVHGIVEQHRGWIEVDSHPGTGTTFRVFLPIHEATPAEMAKPNAEITAPAPGGHETVLLVEDEIPLLTIVSQILRQKGYQVVKSWF
jgi:hypothetical protein